MEKMNCPAGEPPEVCNPGVVASSIDTLKKTTDTQWKRLEEVKDHNDEQERRLDRLESVLKGAAGNGRPSWSERMILIEDWQQRQEKLLAALPSQLAEINIQLQMLLSQRDVSSSARSSAFWMAVGSLLVAVLVGLTSAAIMWWSHAG